MRAMTTADEVLDFWFGADDAARDVWFRKDPGFDAQIRERFGATIERALAGGLAHWNRSAREVLARIIVLDQFTRNAFRDTPRAFAGDALALAAARELVAAGLDPTLTPRQRAFVYLPFEHAEDRALQAEAVQRFEALAAQAPHMAEALEWARRHRDVVERFGRFPHRNEVLGRPSTPEEQAFLLEPGSRF